MNEPGSPTATRVLADAECGTPVALELSIGIAAFSLTMSTRIRIRRFAWLLLLLAPIAVFAAPVTSTLRIDGIVRISGMSITGARAVLIKADGTSEEINDGLQHFTRELPLQTAVLLAFERQGCVTKQLYFDTHVPAEALAMGRFDFPFKVTLEPPPPGQNFHYAGPVGYIRYFPEREDFGYDTDYARVADPSLAARLDQVLQHSAPVAAMPAPLVVDAPAAQQRTDRSDSSAFAVVVPTGEQHGPLVHPTGPRAIPDPTPAFAETAVVAAPVPPPPPPPAPVAVVAEAKEEVRPLPAPKPVVQQVVATQPHPDWQREEEVVVEPRWVIRIVRFVHGGTSDEFRRVEHRFGAVYYFRNGSSVSSDVYQLGIAGLLPGK